MQYAIRHVTHFEYEDTIRESVMEVRMCPRTEAQQQCYSFELSLTPHAQVFSYQDRMGNHIHYFDIPGQHDELKLESRALVEVRPLPDLPAGLDEDTWERIDALVDDGDHMEMVVPSTFARPTHLLRGLADELDVRRRDDPLSLLRGLNTALYDRFAYSPKSTHVNSPIDDAIENGSGVCQDFAHIFIALARSVGIPCRYVSGYLFHRPEGQNGHDRSAEDGSHAWVEAYLPELGWIGFDPTNDVLAGERHVRVAVGRDYDDVPPTRGVYKGDARSLLHVGVHVAKARFPASDEAVPELALVAQGADADVVPHARQSQQQQQ